MRKPRAIKQNAAYHVTARANRQEMILEDEQFKMMFLEVVGQARKKYSFKIRNLCIMGNHVHLDIEPLGQENLSKIMQWILSVFAVRYNRLYDYKGHVWYDRFKSRVIETIRQFINTFFYIASNPVRAGLVNHPLEFAYNGITFYRNGNRAYGGLLDPPEPWLIKLIDDFVENYDREKRSRVIEECSFRDKKPGRPRINR